MAVKVTSSVDVAGSTFHSLESGSVSQWCFMMNLTVILRLPWHITNEDATTTSA
jgi:hypothetical protein